jgi:PilZ domain
MPDEEKRRSPRIQPYVAPCKVLDRARRVSGYVMDLSPTGSRIMVDSEPPAPGSTIVLEVRFARDSPNSVLPGQVRWVKGPEGPKATFTFGMTFEGLTSEQSQVLSSIVEEFRKRAEDLA